MLKSKHFIGWMIAGFIASGAIASCSNQGEASKNSQAQAQQPKEVQLTLVSYAVTQSAYEKIIPKFTEQWKAKTGQDVIFEQSYGGSGSQTRAVIDGLEADVVALALALDTKQIEEAGLIEPNWEQELPNESIVHKSVAALVKRDDSVKVAKWSDLTDENIEVITANPKTSGGARWNYLALWGAMTQAGNSEQEAQAYVEKVFANVPILPKDARESSDVFYQQGQGDVLINYENEVLLAKQQGEDIPYVVPTDYNISIDNPVAVVDANVDKRGTREVAEAFTKFLFTPEAQREFAQAGFRPVDSTVSQEFAEQYPTIKNLFTVKDLGGWTEIQAKFFDSGAEFDKMMTKISQK
ncbi:sulfate ABC transporter substrate-binding protein [Pleurocapsa sp. CCALA 161]|uniref:sulfate ABC transporter substrate-binding protein n=1 Tax=Pleurocapsa sp. CCALA 161 TaxID=2107688 RepID=UPI000D0836F4|nr:sulfate ABC transporter substrate-binding protein [Pleurocapsa sp. CCALA 161]PSB12181.1 sulfate ABC transporter substrate-binding protein [Pleurocapsa sp. CCALA 161]